MSTKHIDTAADLVRFGASLKIECMDCGSERTLSGAETVRLFGAGPLPSDPAQIKVRTVWSEASKADGVAAALVSGLGGKRTFGASAEIEELTE